MILFFAGSENKSYEVQLEKVGARHRLFSYHYLTGSSGDALVKNALKYYENVFLDSGGFSAFTQGVEIDIHKYIDFIKKYGFKTYAVLDVIGCHKGTMRNQRIMEEAGLSPIPCFHFGSDLKDLQSLCEEYDYIALGGLVPHAKDKPKLRKWLRKCFKITHATNTKAHGFGMTGQDILEGFPFYSVDSSSWLAGARYGNVYAFKKNKLISYPYKDKKMALGNLSSKNLEKGDYLERVGISAKAFIEMQDHVTRLWGKRGITYS